MASIRIVPFAPFSVVNLLAGATHIRFSDFMLGTALGMAPGALALILLGDRLAEVMRNPTPASLATLAGAILLLVPLAFGADRCVSLLRVGRRQACVARPSASLPTHFLSASVSPPAPPRPPPP